MSDHGKEAMTDYSDEQIAALVKQLRGDCPGDCACGPCEAADALASLQQAKREALALCDCLSIPP